MRDFDLQETLMVSYNSENRIAVNIYETDARLGPVTDVTNAEMNCQSIQISSESLIGLQNNKF